MASEGRSLPAAIQHEQQHRPETQFGDRNRVRSVRRRSASDRIGRANGDGELECRCTPTTFIINPKGEIAYRAVGGREFDHPEIIKAITDLNSSNDKG